MCVAVVVVVVVVAAFLVVLVALVVVVGGGDGGGGSDGSHMFLFSVHRHPPVLLCETEPRVPLGVAEPCDPLYEAEPSPSDPGAPKLLCEDEPCGHPRRRCGCLADLQARASAPTCVCGRT